MDRLQIQILVERRAAFTLEELPAVPPNLFDESFAGVDCLERLEIGSEGRRETIVD